MKFIKLIFRLINRIKSNRCKECDQKNTGYKWCNSCNAKHFQQNFKNWTSGNDDIDKFIKDIQLSANGYHKLLEWIPYDKLYDIKYIAKGGFGMVYKARWIDGYIHSWSNKNQNWKRLGSNMFVALKSLNNSKNVTLEFINEVFNELLMCDSSTNSLLSIYLSIYLFIYLLNYFLIFRLHYIIKLLTMVDLSLSFMG
jgi:hypothetical protein